MPLRMGINSGPVDEVTDVNGRRNVTGAGINLAQSVMDCADAGHILLSKRVADDLAQYSEWQPCLHDLGEVEVKHGVRVALSNFFGDGFGNPKSPDKIIRAKQARRRASYSGYQPPVVSGLSRTRLLDVDAPRRFDERLQNWRRRHQ